MKVVFRVDASLEIGTGHVMRCLTLAGELKNKGAEITFITRPHTGNMDDIISDRVHKLFSLSIPDDSYQPEKDDTKHASWLGVPWEQDAEETKTCIENYDVDWLVVDHYGIDVRWQKNLRDSVDKIMIIDDLADRSHECDILLDQNLGRKSADYICLVPEDCHILAGPKYSMLRPEFAELREYSLRRRRDAKFQHVLISMGGVDKHNVTGKILELLKTCVLPKDCLITIILGKNAPWFEVVKMQASKLAWKSEVLINTSDMAQYMADSDLAIGAACSSSWERCCLGLPSIIFCLAENQKMVFDEMKKQNIAETVDIQQLENLEPISFCKKVEYLMKNLDTFSHTSMQLINGLGREEVVHEMYSML